MTKKVKNGLVENQEEKVVETATPKQEVKVERTKAKLITPGHATRAFRS